MSTNDDFGYISSSSGNGGGDGGGCATRKVVRSQCRTEEVEPGKFVRKCEKTEQIFKDCAGRPSEMVESSKEYTEEDVTGQMVKGSFSSKSPEPEIFNFPGLRSDIDTNFRGLRSDLENIERNFFGNINKFFEAAEEFKNGFFNSVGAPGIFGEENNPSHRDSIPIESPLPKEADSNGEFDLSGLARDV